MRIPKALTLALRCLCGLLFLLPAGRAAAQSGSGMAVDGAASLRLVGYYSIDGKAAVVVSDGRPGNENISVFAEGERGGRSGPGCERLDVVNGICVLHEGGKLLTVRLPVPLDSGVGESSLWLTNLPAYSGLLLLGELAGRTPLVPESLKGTRIPALVCATRYKTNAVQEMVRVYDRQDIALVPHGEKWMLALPKAEKERYLKALPTPPEPANSGRRIRAGMIRFIGTPVPQVAAIYGELVGRKPGRIPSSAKGISLALMTEVTYDEANHMIQAILLLNGWKVVLVGDTAFDLVEW